MSFFSPSKSSYYEQAPDATASREERSNRLKIELRDHIRSFGDYKFLSVEWLKMAESMQQVATVAFMETHLPGSEQNSLKQQGKKNVGTLWDQEKDELAVRILLEEGKLNLCLRILQNYKEAERQPDYQAQIETVAKAFEVEVARVVERCKTFERSLGGFLRISFEHVEALQILDLPNLVAHCAQVLMTVLAANLVEAPAEFDKMQESVVIQYLACIADKMEEINEDRMMELFNDNNIYNLLITFVHKHHAWLKNDTLEAFIRFLNLSMGSEAYVTEPNAYVGKVETKKMLLSLRGAFLEDLMKTFPERRQTQHLQDNLAKFARLYPDQ